MALIYANAFFEFHKDYNSNSQKKATNFKQFTELFFKEKKIQNVQVEVKCVKKFRVSVIKRCQYLFETRIEKHNCVISQQFSIWKEK